MASFLRVCVVDGELIFVLFLQNLRSPSDPELVLCGFVNFWLCSAREWCLFAAFVEVAAFC